MLDKWNIRALEAWGKQPFASESEMIEALTDSEYRDKRNPIYRLAVQAKLRLPDTWSVGTTAPVRQHYKTVDGYGYQPKE